MTNEPDGKQAAQIYGIHDNREDIAITALTWKTLLHDVANLKRKVRQLEDALWKERLKDE